MSQEFNPKTFSNSKEELEFYRNIYKIKLEELSTCQTKIKALENINNKLKNQIIQGFSNNLENNESSKNIFTPNEFKTLWETVIQTELIDSFDFCIKEYKLISYLSQEIILLIYEETKKIIELKFLEILKCLNLSKTSKIKKESLYLKILPFFRENFNSIFELNEEGIKNIKQKLQKIINQYNFLNEINLIKNSSSKVLNDININSKDNDIRNSNVHNIENDSNAVAAENLKILENKIKGKNFEGIMKSFFTICLYMLLHEPILNFNIEKYSQRKLIYYFYNKKNFINVEGFGDEKTPCVIILQPPLLKQKYPFNGIRPAVYILPDTIINKEILNECENNEKNLEKEDKTQNNENKNINNTNNNAYNSNDKKTKIKNKIVKNHIDQKFKKENNFEIFKKTNKTNNINDYEKKNIQYNNYTKNNADKVLNKSAKINNSGNQIFVSIDEININNNNYKMINKNKINIKNNIPEKKYDNNIDNKDENNNFVKKAKQNLSYSHIQNQNQKKIIINQNKYQNNKYMKNNNNYKNDNYFIKYNENNNNITERRMRKEKTLPEKFKYNTELELSDNIPILNYSHKLSNEKNNYISYGRKTFENAILNPNINNNNQILNQRKNSNNFKNNNNNIYLNKTNNNSKDKNINKNMNPTIREEKFKRNNTVGIPSSEKLNIKYYSSFNNLLAEKNNKYERQLTNINDNNNYITLKKNNINKFNQEYDNNLKKYINYYSYDEYYNYHNNNNYNVNYSNKFSDRKKKIKQNKIIFNNKDDANIINDKKRGLETSVQQNKYNIYNIKDNYLIDKNNLFNIFNSINNDNNIKNEKTLNNTFGNKKRMSLNQNINYINNINNINNYNNINNINNINYNNNIYSSDNQFIKKNHVHLNQLYLKDNLEKKNNIDNNIKRSNIKNNNNNNDIYKINRSLKVNNNKNNLNVDNQYNNYIINNKNENIITNERNKLGQSLSPYNFISHNQINTPNIHKNNLNKNNNNLNEEISQRKNKNHINSKQNKIKYIQKNPKINLNQNNGDVNTKNNFKKYDSNINNMNYKIPNDINIKQKNNINKNKNNKKRNKSLNSNHLYYNNNMNNFYGDNKIKNKINKKTYNNEYEISNKNYNNQNIENNFNESYNMNNFYLNELEVFKLNDKYKFSDSLSKEYDYS